MKVGLIGAGRIGDIHAGSLAAHPDVDSLVVADYDPGLAGKLAARYGAEAVLDAVERSLESREGVTPETERTKGGVHG